MPIVEGDGEVSALPVLLRRLNQWLTPEQPVNIGQPIRVRRDRFIQRELEFRRFLELAASKCGEDGWVLLLLDADDDCPARCAPALLQRAQEVIRHRAISVVMANREYEAWFIAAAASLAGVRGLQIDTVDLALDPEVPRDAKGWIKDRMPGHAYGPTTDQAAFSGRMDLEQAAQRSRSFRKLRDEWLVQCTA